MYGVKTVGELVKELKDYSPDTPIDELTLKFNDGYDREYYKED